jgi:hypothetical protein
VRRLAALVAAATLATSLMVGVGDAAASPPGGGESCDPYTGVCTVIVTQPGTPGGGSSSSGSGGGSSGGVSGCHWGATAFPCYDAQLGWFDNEDGCYYRAADPQPPPDDPVWVGHSPGDGAVYTRTCEGLMYVPVGSGGFVQAAGATTVWLAAPPPGSPVVPPPAATLAQRALAQLRLPTMTAASNGGASQTSYVGVPTWLWVDDTGWHAMTATAAVGARSVTLTATPVSVTWSMGDGGSVACDGPGEPFSQAAAQDPPCGYTYRVSSADQPQSGSQTNDRHFTVQGSVDFAMHWVCSGDCDQAAGYLPDVARATTPLPLRVFEVQTVVVNH